MSHLKFDKLNINGHELQGSELKRFCDSKLKGQKIADWEIPIYQFLFEWLDEKEEIKVQTSGSTGQPKPITLRKEHMINSAKATAKALNLKSDQTALLALSANFIAGKMMIVRALVNRLKLIAVEPTGNPLKNLDAQIDFTALVPLQLSNILKSVKEVKKLKKIEKVLIGGGAISEPMVQDVASFPNHFYSSYGMTETCTHIALRKLNGALPNIYYKTLPEVKVSIDQRSCLVIDAPNVCETNLVTNDLAKLISETDFLIEGRYDNIINSGGIKISPEKIEQKLTPIIENHFLISAIPDESLGEKIILLIEEEETDLEKLFGLWKQLEAILDPYETPKVIDFLSSFSYTASGKIDRKKTTKLFLT